MKNNIIKLIPLLFVLISVLIGTVKFSIPIEFILIIGIVLSCIIARMENYKWEEITNAMIKKITDTHIAIFIFLLIGVIAGTWIYSGTIPMLIYYGIKFIHPSFIPLTAFIITSLLSIFTGTSWGSVATAGVAFIGIANATGASLPLIAGAIISGAYLGDKNSPMSDTTVLASIGAGTTIQNHIKSMLVNTIPSAIIAIILFTILGLQFKANNIENVKETTDILKSLDAIFNFNILLLIPPIFVLIASIKGLSPIITMFSGSIIAIILGMIFQDFGFVNATKSFVTGFNTSMINKEITTIPDILSILLNRGGMSSMMSSVLFLILALTYGSLLQSIGTLDTLIKILLKTIKGVRSLIITTWFSIFIINSALSSLQFLFITIGAVLKDVYKKYDVDLGILSRTMEEGGTLTEVLLPWSITGMYMTATLGVPTLQYLPYSFFNLSGVVLSFLFALFLPLSSFKNKENI